MAVAPGEACYVPLGHRASSEAFDFGAHDGIVQIPVVEALALL
jgi:DNA polymerase-1